MKKTTTFMSIFIIVLLSSIVMAGCSYSFSSSSSHSEGTIERSLMAFGGEEKKSLKFTEGDKIAIDYKVKVDSGALIIRLEDPDNKELWNVTLDKSSSDIAEIPVKKTGTYVVYLKGENIDGSCNIKISNK